MAIYLGNVPTIDLYSGSAPIDRVYLGQSKIYDAFAEISGNLPLSFNARRAENLNDYTIYGTPEGAGVETENLFDVSDFINNYIAGYTKDNNGNVVASSGGVSGYSTYTIPVNQTQVYYLRGKTKPSLGFYGAFRLYFLNTDFEWIGRTEQIDQFNETSIYEFTTPANTSYLQIQTPVTLATPDMRLMIIFTPPDHYIPHGYKLPLTVESGEQSQDISIYIGDSKLGAEEYVDFGEQKIYKDVSGTLTPTDPPAPIQPIPSYAGANRLYSTITLGEVTVQGRIKNNLPEWYKDGWEDLLGPDSWYEPWRVIVAAATKPSSGTTPNCTIVYGSFQDYYEFNTMAIKITDLGDALRFDRANDRKKRKFVTYDSNTRTWGTVTSADNSGYFALGNIVQNIPVKAFIIFTTPNYPGGYKTTLPYQDDL